MTGVIPGSAISLQGWSYGQAFTSTAPQITVVAGNNQLTGFVGQALALPLEALVGWIVTAIRRRGVASCAASVTNSAGIATCSTGSPPWVGTDGSSQSYFSELNNNQISKEGGDFTSAEAVLTSQLVMTCSSFPFLTSSVLPTNGYF